jgi:glycosyltransferase involved in cell wall biosynthesis
MKIAFNYGLGKERGGSRIFVNRLADYLEKNGCTIKKGISDDCDLVFILIEENPDNLLHLNPKIKIVQRLDGVWFNTRQDFLSQNYLMTLIHQKADAIVYQSQFSKVMCHRYLGNPKSSAIQRIIYNGADNNLFSPEGPVNKFGFKYMVLANSRWRPHKRLKTIVNGFLELNRDDTVLVILGEVEEKVFRNNIIYTGWIETKDLPTYYRSADITIFLSWIDWCPNVVVESLVVGTSVICSNIGGTPELVKDSGVVLNVDPLYDLNPVDLYSPPEISPKVIAEAIELLLQNPERLTKRPRKDLFMETCGKEYLELFKELLEH